MGSNNLFKIKQNPLRRISWRSALVVLGLATGLSSSMAATGPSGAEEIAIWPGTAPGSQGATAKQEVVERSKDPAVKDRAVFGVTRPTLEIWKPQNPNGTAVIVMPGGAYERVVVDKEGMEMGERLTKDGITVFVLTYRLPVGGHAQPSDVALQDAQRAIRLVRKNAQEWGLKPDHIGVMGFSAGGHVAASLGTGFDKKVYAAVDDADTISARPDFLALIYPVISMEPGVTHEESRRNLLGADPSEAAINEYSADKHVRPDMPPTFLLHADDDSQVATENTIRFYRALKAAKVSAELHIFRKGEHGFGLRFTKGLPVAVWPDLYVGWARNLQMIP
jgi:acetyl esterase/lipase